MAVQAAPALLRWNSPSSTPKRLMIETRPPHSWTFPPRTSPLSSAIPCFHIAGLGAGHEMGSPHRFGALVIIAMPLRILILSHHFPPEVSAGANRFYEMAKVWIQAGHSVTVVACAPNHPTGKAYPGYENSLWKRETVDGIEVIRVWTFLSPNTGIVRRALSFSSYLVSATIGSLFIPKPDLVISTVPHIFCGLAGFAVSSLRRTSWIFDVRDLWPESIVSVGAMNRGRIIRFLEAIERFCYHNATHIVSASGAYLPHFLSMGIASEKISVITNGVDLKLFHTSLDPAAFLKSHDLEGKFVVSYVGTHGLAHNLDVILEAADRLRSRNDIAFLLVGDGAQRDRLMERRRAMGLANVLMLPQLSRDQIPAVLTASGASVVTLRPTPLFELVIPSKMFEAMALGRPIILGVRGEAKRIIEEGQCGVTFSPGSADELARQVEMLAGDPALCRRLGENGRRFVAAKYDRDKLAAEYLTILTQVAGAQMHK